MSPILRFATAFGSCKSMVRQRGSVSQAASLAPRARGSLAESRPLSAPVRHILHADSGIHRTVRSAYTEAARDLRKGLELGPAKLRRMCFSVQGGVPRQVLPIG